MENTKMVALIGNREIRFSILKEKLDAVRRLYPDAMWISNGTIGADLMIAKYAMRNRIPLFMCIPYPPEIMSADWVKGWQNSLSGIVKKFGVNNHRVNHELWFIDNNEKEQQIGH